MTQELAENDAPRGIFITFEGGEGAGKTTHIRFLSEKLCERGREVVRLREPGGTAVGEELRAVVLDPKNDNLSDEAELLIYEAARARAPGRRWWSPRSGRTAPRRRARAPGG